MRAGRTVKVAALAVASTTMLAGCGMTPGAAATVGSQTISHDEVDEVAQAVCSANMVTSQASGQPAPSLPSRGAREVAMSILLETELSQQFGEAEGVTPDPQQVAQAVAQNEQGLAMLPEDQRDIFSETLREYAEGQLMLIEVGKSELGPQTGDDEALAEGSKLRAAYAKGIDVEVDPRFGSFADGRFQPGGASLSVPASDRAVQGAEQQPGEEFVGGLPASQLCS